MSPDPVELAAKLITIRTIDSASEEGECLDLLGRLLQSAGFDVIRHKYGDGRSNLVARIQSSEGSPICFTGHIDTVPLGDTPWKRDPFGAEIVDGRLYGRGSTDMKGGVAAIICAACACARDPTANVLLIITSGEEIGCKGAAALVDDITLPSARGLIVAEPTNNITASGHKGALWLKAIFSGVTAHGSMPHLGINAAYKAAHAMVALEQFEFLAKEHPLGRPTLNVGTVHAGINVNSVPAEARLLIDIRSVPSLSHVAARDQLKGVLQECETVEEIVNLSAVWTDPHDPWLRKIESVSAQVTGREPANPGSASYFTDAALLAPALSNPPVAILGPGDPLSAHASDEYCRVDQIREAFHIYSQLILN